MKIAIDHLGIAVNNLQESLRFYSNVLGFEVSGTEVVDVEQVEVAMLPAGNEGARLELLQATSPESPIAISIAKRGPGLHHIALRVTDLSEALRRLRAAGCQLLNEVRAGAGGHRYVFVHPRSSGGVLLELIDGQEE